MSRIEEALNKAAAMREMEQKNVPSAPVSKSGFSERKVIGHTIPFVKTEIPERLKLQKDLVTLNAPSSQAAEEYRKLKESIVNLTKKEGFKNTLLVSSPSMGEGKSITATNLAISLAQELDFTVLLIDADLRKPSCHELLKMDNSVGLSDYLTADKDISEVIARTGIGKLSFISSGKLRVNPGELLASNRMRMLLSEVKERYPDRYIIMDTPPILPFAETRSLSRMVDGVVLVVREGGSSQKDVVNTLEELRGAKVLGSVLNASQRSGWSNVYGSYGYGYSAPDESRE